MNVCLWCSDEGIYDAFYEFFFLLDPINTLWVKTIPWWMHKSMTNIMNKESTLLSKVV